MRLTNGTGGGNWSVDRPLSRYRTAAGVHEVSILALLQRWFLNERAAQTIGRPSHATDCGLS